MARRRTTSGLEPRTTELLPTLGNAIEAWRRVPSSERDVLTEVLVELATDSRRCIERIHAGRPDYPGELHELRLSLRAQDAAVALLVAAGREVDRG